MNTKNLIKIINEEISEFDFLGMKDIKEEENFVSLVNSKDFQVNLMNDLATKNYNNNISDFDINTTYSNIDDLNDFDDTIKFEYGADFVYNFNNNKVSLYLTIDGDVPFNISGEYRTATYLEPSEKPRLEKADYKYATINLFTKDGEEIDISWVNQNNQLKQKIIENLIGDYPDF